MRFVTFADNGNLQDAQLVAVEPSKAAKNLSDYPKKATPWLDSFDQISVLGMICLPSAPRDANGSPLLLR